MFSPSDLAKMPRHTSLLEKAQATTRARNSYKFRNLPMTAGTWAVVGDEINDTGDIIGTGVLEWCVSFEDASNVYNTMRRYNHQFANLSFCDWAADKK